MTLPASPPRYDGWPELVSPIRKGDTGWRGFALQASLNDLRPDGAGSPWPVLDLDGEVGTLTTSALRSFQLEHNLESDGIAGGKTQEKILTLHGSDVHAELPDIPDGLMRGLAEGEGANVLAATNWSVAGGVDCGPMQLRCLGAPFGLSDLMRAFRASKAMPFAARIIAARSRDFVDDGWVQRQGERRQEWAMRIAVLAHNWPAGASSWAAMGTCSQPDMKATWVPAGTRFDDGTPVRTRREWCEFYALGGPHGPGRITRYVRDWS